MEHAIQVGERGNGQGLPGRLVQMGIDGEALGIGLRGTLDNVV